MTLDVQARRRRQDAGPGADAARPDRFPCFDGLRAIAALTVIGVHTSFISGLTNRLPGWGRYTSRLEIGVEVFFVISGFLLYRPYAVAHFGGRPAAPARHFWTRRLKRIIPAYWVAFVLVVYGLRAETIPHTWDAPLIYLSFTQLYLPHYALGGISQAWSLCTEMTFYLMIPFYAAWLGRNRRTADRQLQVELAGLAILTAISFAYRIPVLMVHGQMSHVMPNWLPGYLDQFALGMLLAVVSAWTVAVDHRPRWLWHPLTPWACWALAGAAFVAVSNLGLPLLPLIQSSVPVSLARQMLYGIFAFCLVLPAVFGPQDRGAVRRFLRWRPVALVGVASYGVYLWHKAWIQMYLDWTHDREFAVWWPAMLVTVTALAVASGWVSYRLVERPVLVSGRRAPRPATVDATTTLIGA